MPRFSNPIRRGRDRGRRQRRQMTPLEKIQRYEQKAAHFADLARIAREEYMAAQNAANEDASVTADDIDGA